MSSLIGPKTASTGFSGHNLCGWIGVCKSRAFHCSETKTHPDTKLFDRTGKGSLLYRQSIAVKSNSNVLNRQKLFFTKNHITSKMSHKLKFRPRLVQNRRRWHLVVLSVVKCSSALYKLLQQLLSLK